MTYASPRNMYKVISSATAYLPIILMSYSILTCSALNLRSRRIITYFAIFAPPSTRYGFNARFIAPPNHGIAIAALI